MARPGQEDGLAGQRRFPLWKNQRTNPADGAEDAGVQSPRASATSNDGAAPADDVNPDTPARQIAPDAVKHWARELNVPAPRLREAIRRVGPRVEEVRRFLAGAPR